MIVRAGFLVVAIVSVIKVCQFTTNRRSRRPSTSEHGKASFREEQIAKENGNFEVDPGKQEKQVKTSKSKSLEQLDTNRDVSEIDLLRNMVKEKDKMRVSLEIRLFELYCLKEQQSKIPLLQRQLNDRTSEIDMLVETINRLQAERKNLYEEVKQNELAVEQLERAKLTILELQGQMELDSGQMNDQITMLKQKVSCFHKEGESKVPNKIDKKLKSVKVVELKALEIKRRNIELQLEKRELVLKLKATESKIAELSTMTEHKLVAKYQVELSRLRHVNKNLIEQVDKLHRSRLSILEELVYQRLLNTCLRFELEDYHSPSPKKINQNVSRKLGFRSDSNSSGISSIESDEVTNTTRSSSSSENTKKKKKGLLQNIKIWGRSKNISSANASESGFIPSKAGKIRRFSTSSIPPDISSLRNREESELLFPWQKKEAVDSNSPELPMIRRVRRVSFNDSINSVRYIYDDSPESDKNISENDRKKAENSNDSSDMKTSPGTGPLLERNNAEMPSPTFNVQRHEKFSTGLGNQDKIETQVVSRKETVQVECLSSAMPNAASGASKFGDVVNAIAAFTGTGPLLERNNAEMPSPTFNVQRHEKFSTGLGNQDKIETQVVSRKETVQVECLSSAMPNAASGASKFGDVVNAIAAFTGTGPLLERNNAEMPSPTFNVQRHEKVSTGLGNQDKIETQVVSRKETVQVECLSSAMPNAASGASKFGDVVNAIAAFIIVFFLVLVYFRFFFTFKPKRSLIVLTLNKLFRLRS